MVNLAVLSPHPQSTYRDAHAVASIPLRYGAKPRKSTREQRVHTSSLAKQTNQEVSDWYHVSVLTLWNNIFFLKVPFTRACCLPSLALWRRICGLRRRSCRTPACRSGADWFLLNVQVNFPDCRRAQAGPLMGHSQPARWVNFGSFSKACLGIFFYSGFLVF